jgi:hypothetical protein
MKERLTRILIFSLIVLVTIVVIKGLSDRIRQSKAKGETIDLPQVPVKEELEDLGEKVLGEAAKILPGAPKFEEVEESEEVEQTNQEVESTEPIKEPVKDVQKQTEILIETIKELPQDQLEAIKKQIWKEVCEEILIEE